MQAGEENTRLRIEVEKKRIEAVRLRVEALENERLHIASEQELARLKADVKIAEEQHNAAKGEQAQDHVEGILQLRQDATNLQTERDEMSVRLAELLEATQTFQEESKIQEGSLNTQTQSQLNEMHNVIETKDKEKQSLRHDFEHFRQETEDQHSNEINTIRSSTNDVSSTLEEKNAELQYLRQHFEDYKTQ